MSKIKTYVGSDGNIHFTNSAGADTVLPFSSNKISKIGTKILEKSVYLSGSTGSVEIPITSCKNFILFSSISRGNSTAAQMDHTLTTDNGTITHIRTISSSSLTTNLWIYEKSEIDKIGTISVSAGRGDTTFSLMVFETPYDIENVSVTISGNTDDNYQATASFSSNTESSVYFLLSLVTRGNSTADQLVHQLRSDNGVFEHYQLLGNSSYIVCLWIYRKNNKSIDDVITVNARRGEAAVGLDALKLY